MDRELRVARNSAQPRKIDYPISIEWVEGHGYRIVVIINKTKYYGLLSKDPSDV